jgi:hypothetical protein
MDLVSASAVWDKVRAAVKIQNETLYQTHVQRSQVQAVDNGSWTIGVFSQASQQWLTYRPDIVAQPLASLGYAPELTFVVSQAAPAKAETPVRGPIDPVYDLDFYNPKMKIGRWLPELQYDHLFWLSYLGGAYLFYRHLLMDWVKRLRKKEIEAGILDMTRPENHCLTPPFKLSYRQATKWLGKRNYKLIPGGEWECHRSGDLRKVGARLAACQECHDPHDWRTTKVEGGGRCFYWRPGLLHRLYDEQLVTVEISATGRAQVQAWRVLPLLTPWQVDRLDSYLQGRHEDYLKSHEEALGLSLDEWEAIDYPYMNSHRNNHGTIRLFGRPPQNPFLPPHGCKNKVGGG